MLLDHEGLVLDTHIFQIRRSTDIVTHASKHSRFGQTSRWEVFHRILRQSVDIDTLVYCDVEQSLRSEESNEHPRYTDEETMDRTVACGGYVKMESAPNTYDDGAEAKGENPKRGPLPRFSNPQERRIAGSGSIAYNVLHLFYP